MQQQRRRFSFSIGELMLVIAAGTVVLGLPAWLGTAGWITLGWITGPALMAGLTIALSLAIPPQAHRTRTTNHELTLVQLAVIFESVAIALCAEDYWLLFVGRPTGVNALSQATGCTLSVAAFSFASASITFGEEARRRVIGTFVSILVISASALPAVLVAFAWALYFRAL